MRTSRARVLAVSAACVLQCAAQAASQAPAAGQAAEAPAPAASRATFRARTETVSVEVLALDEKGAPVEGLGPSDFLVTVEGQPRTVTAAAYVGRMASDAVAPGSAAGDTSTPAPIAGEGYVTNEGTVRPRVLVLAIDESHVRPMSARPLLDAAGGLLDTLAPNDLVAVARLPRLTQGVDFTTDRAVVKAGLSQVTGRGVPLVTASTRLSLGLAVEFLRGVGPVRQEVLDSRCANKGSFAISRPETGAATAVQQCIALVGGESRELVSDASMWARDAVFGFERLLEALTRVPGAKRVLLFTEGLYVGDDLKMLSRAQALATAAHATITVIVPEGAPRDASDAGPLMASDPTPQLMTRGLDELAGGTGGSLVKVIGTGQELFKRIGREMSGYYTIGFTPEAVDRDGKVHGVKVRIERPGVTVRSHREFSIDDNRPPPSPEQRLRALLASPVTESALPLHAALVTSPVAGGRVRAFVQTIVGRDTDSAKDASAAASIVDAAGKVVTSFTLESAALNDRDPRNGRVLGGARDLDPGEYRVRVAAVLPDGRAGSLETTLRARPHEAGELSYSDLMVGLRPQAGQAFRPVPEPVVDRELLMAVELVSAEPDITSAAQVRFEIAETPEGDSLVDTPVEVPTGRRAATAAGSFQLTLPPGAYIARARVTPPGGEPVLLTRRFTVIAPAGEAGDVGPRIDAARATRPAFPPYTRERALRQEIVAPFLDYIAKVYPPGAAGAAALEKARAGTFEVPAAAPAREDAVAYALVRGLGAIRDNTPEACVTAFNDTVERAEGFIGLAAFQGACYALAGHDRDAIAAWQMALMGNVGTAAIYEQIVDAQLRIGEAEAALETLAEGDLQWTDRAGFDRRRGLALALLDRHKEALPLLDAAAADPSADRELLFFVLQAMHVGRTAGWLDASQETKARFEQYLERYTSQKGSQAATVKGWRKAW